MATARNYRSDNTYIVVGGDGVNPKLVAKVLRNGLESLYLDYFFGSKTITDPKTGKTKRVFDRKRENLSLSLFHTPRTPLERTQNKEALEVAKRVRWEKEQQLKQDIKGYRLNQERQAIGLVGYFQTYLSKYTKKDWRMIKIAMDRFTDFLASTEEYKNLRHDMSITQLTKPIVEAYTEYLQTRSKGTGAKSIYNRFKKVINHAIEEEILTTNPCKGVTIKVDENVLRKETLSTDEIRQLFRCHPSYVSNDIRRAFMFSLYTGLRYCDVSNVTYSMVDYSNRTLKVMQMKTQHGVVIPLNNTTMAIIGEPPTNRDDRIFPLHSYEYTTRMLRRWVAEAGITKHISWHCARHSFATNILMKGANIKVVASLLGHTSLRHTEQYTRVVDSMKQAAVDSLPNDIEI